MIPKGLDMLLEVRRQGFRPEYPVFVLADRDKPRPPVFVDMPIAFEICIRPSDRVEDLDLRGLIGLSIAVAVDSMNERARNILRAIVKAQPALVAGGALSENLIFCWRPGVGWEHAHV